MTGRCAALTLRPRPSLNDVVVDIERVKEDPSSVSRVIHARRELIVRALDTVYTALRHRCNFGLERWSEWIIAVDISYYNNHH